MKKIASVLLSLILALSATACTASNQSEPITPIDESQSSSSEVSSGAESNADESEEEMVLDDSLLCYRGVVEDIAVSDDGNTVLILNGPQGSGVSPMKIKLTENTQGTDAQFGNGSFLEIQYEDQQEEDESYAATSIIVLESVDAVSYNGTLVEVIRDGENGQLLMDPLMEDGVAYAFNFGPETVFYVDLESLQPGDKLNIYHSSMATRSIPPQSPAIEVRPYVEEGNAVAAFPG